MAWLQTSNKAVAVAAGIFSVSVTAISAVSIGDRVVLSCATWSSLGTPIPTLTDDLGNTYELDVQATFADSGGTAVETVFSGAVTVTGTPVFTLKLVAAASLAGDGSVAYQTYTGINTATGTGHTDGKVMATGTGGTASSGATASTTAANELVVGSYLDDGWGTTIVAGTGYTMRITDSPSAQQTTSVEDKDSGAGLATQTATVTGAGTAWAMGAVVYKLAGAVTSLPPGLGPGEHMQPAMTMPMGW